MNKYLIRRLFQVFFFVVAFLIATLTTRFIAHSYCPYAIICFGVRALNPASFLVFVGAIIGGGVILLSVLFIGRRFCGYVCPLGTLSEYLHYLNPFKQLRKKKKIPGNLDRRLRVGKYLMVIFTATSAFLLWTGYYYLCPAMLFTRSTEILTGGAIVIALIVLGSLFIKRIWCRYLCGLAALMNLFQLLGRTAGIKRNKINRNLEVCNDCMLCETECQMNINIIDTEQVEDTNCIYCLDCVKICPKNALK